MSGYAVISINLFPGLGRVGSSVVFGGYLASLSILVGNLIREIRRIAS